MAKNDNRWIILIFVTIAGVLLDWFTKYLADSNLTFGLPVSLMDDFIQLLLVYNKGAIFGFNPKSYLPRFPVNTFLIIFTFAAIAMLIIYFKNTSKKDTFTQWGLIIILPGAIGNLLDRFLHPDKGVVDFIKIGVSQNVYWPIFNFADIFITLGVVILSISFIKDEIYRRKEK